jgi:recombination protein RecA
MSKTSDAIQKKLKLDNPETEWGFISTGIASVDSALGGGLAKGKIVEIFGPESAAKTTLCLSVSAATQRNGGDVLFIDAEHAIDPAWARKNGVDWDAFGVIQPDSAEQALEAVELAIEMGTDLIIVDSVAAMSTIRELNGDLGDSNVGDKARLMSQSMRRLSGMANRSGSTVIFINQIREKIGVLFGSPETTPGGRALKFHAAQRIDTRRTEALKQGEITYGVRIKVKVVKNKVAAPFAVTNYYINFDIGIDREQTLLEFASERGVVEKSGAWFSFGGTQLGQGAAKSAVYLRENPDVFAEIEKAVTSA